MYKNKYLKYKQKYLQLKGGMFASSTLYDVIFHTRQGTDENITNFQVIESTNGSLTDKNYNINIFFPLKDGSKYYTYCVSTGKFVNITNIIFDIPNSVDRLQLFIKKYLLNVDSPIIPRFIDLYLINKFKSEIENLSISRLFLIRNGSLGHATTYYNGTTNITTNYAIKLNTI